MNMKRKIGMRTPFIFVLTVAVAAALAGCGQSNGSEKEGITAAAPTASITQESGSLMGERGTDTPELPAGVEALEVRFGDDGEPFIMNLDDNPTAAAIAGYVGTIRTPR